MTCLTISIGEEAAENTMKKAGLNDPHNACRENENIAEEKPRSLVRKVKKH